MLDVRFVSACHSSYCAHTIFYTLLYSTRFVLHFERTSNPDAKHKCKHNVQIPIRMCAWYALVHARRTHGRTPCARWHCDYTFFHIFLTMCSLEWNIINTEVASKFWRLDVHFLCAIFLLLFQWNHTISSVLCSAHFIAFEFVVCGTKRSAKMPAKRITNSGTRCEHKSRSCFGT